MVDYYNKNEPILLNEMTLGHHVHHLLWLSHHLLLFQTIRQGRQDEASDYDHVWFADGSAVGYWHHCGDCKIHLSTRPTQWLVQFLQYVHLLWLYFIYHLRCIAWLGHIWWPVWRQARLVDGEIRIDRFGPTQQTASNILCLVNACLLHHSHCNLRVVA